MDKVYLTYLEENFDRLDKFIADSVEGLSRNAVGLLIEQDRVLVNGKTVSKSYKLKPNDEIVVDIPAPVDDTAQPENIPLDIVYEDEDYITYLKSEMLDAVYLQQNSFDLIEANCGRQRQRYITDKLVYILGSSYAVPSKDDARSFFNRMRQKFIDWNYTEFESEAFKKAESEINALYCQCDGKLSAPAEKLLKDGE